MSHGNLFKRKKLYSLLIKPAGPDCNLRCDYCFYSAKKFLFPGNNLHRMGLKILEETTRQLLTQGERQVFFNWQGGEPTLIGLDFFKQALSYQQKYAGQHQVANTIQTNGLLIDKNWARFFRENTFLVGLSLDGPEHVHNRYRHFPNGAGSWSKVLDSAKLLLDSGVATNALVVVNDYSAEYPEEIYEFLKSLGLTYMQFIPCLEPDPMRPGIPANFSVPAERYGDFLIKLFELWKADFQNGQPSTYIRNFESLVFAYAGLTPPECTWHKECGDYLVVEHNGDIYSCDFFVLDEWKLGNIMEKRLIDMLNSAPQKKFGQRKTLLPDECQRCPWLAYCRGGCPRERGYQPEPERTYFCKSYQRFFNQANAFFIEITKNLSIDKNRG